MDINISSNVTTVMKEMWRRSDGISTYIAVLLLVIVGSYRCVTNLYNHVDDFHEWKIVYICFGFIPLIFLSYFNLAIFGKVNNKINRIVNSVILLLIPLVIIINFI